MHPQYIGRPGRLMMLDRLLHHIKTFPNVSLHDRPGDGRAVGKPLAITG